MKKNIQSSLAQKLSENFVKLQQDNRLPARCFIGFDGFTDEIIDAVATRQGPDHYTAMTLIQQLGQRILDSAGKSCNIELVVKEKKLGGNAPILTNALLEGGHHITFIGAIGAPSEIEPLFLPMASRCEKVYAICPSGHSQAVEFQDGKIIFGKHATIIHLDYASILKGMGLDSLIKELDNTDLFVSANWTMLPMMTDAWNQIAKEIVPHFKNPDKQRWLFVDLADPAKRSDDDIREALTALRSLQAGFSVILGLNEAEAIRIGKVLGSTKPGGDSTAILALAQDIWSLSELYQIVIHTTRYAAGVNQEESKIVEGPYIEKPLILTGAGDNFNAGVCNALLYGLSLEECLLSGVFTSAFYIKSGHSPTMAELTGYLTENL